MSLLRKLNRLLLILGLAVFLCGSSGFTLAIADASETESESPIEDLLQDSAEEAIRLRESRADSPVRKNGSRLADGRSRLSKDSGPFPRTLICRMTRHRVQGHRLANGLNAPLLV